MAITDKRKNKLPIEKIEAFAEAILDILFDKAIGGNSEWEISNDLCCIELRISRKKKEEANLPGILRYIEYQTAQSRGRKRDIGCNISFASDDESIEIHTKDEEEMLRLISFYKVKLNKKSITCMKGKLKTSETIMKMLKEV